MKTIKNAMKRLCFFFALLITFLLFLPLAHGERLCDVGMAFVPRPAPVAFAYYPASSHGQQLGSLFRLGHSSHLLISPENTKILMDPHPSYIPEAPPDAVTVSNFHSTHNNAGLVRGSPLIFYGMGEDGRYIQVDRFVGDVRLRNMPTGPSPVSGLLSWGNSLFAFQVNGVCLVHFGNIRNELSREQLAQLGRVDVALLPVDGYITIPHETLYTLIEQIKPAVVVPMHYDGRESAERFLALMMGRYPIRRMERLPIGRQALPERTEVVILSEWRGGN